MQAIKKEPNEQETEPNAQCFLICFDKYHFYGSSMKKWTQKNSTDYDVEAIKYHIFHLKKNS